MRLILALCAFAIAALALALTLVTTGAAHMKTPHPTAFGLAPGLGNGR
jgi:hypothetical protein